MGQTVRLSGASRKLVKLAALHRAYRMAYKGKCLKPFVPGTGNLDARVLIVGELPGLNEIREGKPYVGKSGKTLDKLLRRVDLTRDDVWLTNLLKQRPRIGREYFKEEIASLHGLMKMEIGIIQPNIVVTLGREAAGLYFQQVHMPSIAGKMHIKDNGRMVVVPLYTPAEAAFDKERMEEMRAGIMAVGQAMKGTKRK